MSASIRKRLDDLERQVGAGNDEDLIECAGFVGTASQIRRILQEVLQGPGRSLALVEDAPSLLLPG